MCFIVFFVLMTREDMDIRSAEYSALYTHLLFFFRNVEHLFAAWVCLLLSVDLKERKDNFF